MTNRHSLLIVDSDRNLAQILGALFNAQGVRVTHVSRLRDAVAKLSMQKFSVVLLEPILNGGEPGEESIRAAQDPSGFNQRTPFVLMTGAIQYEIPVSLVPPVKRILLKPFKIDQLNRAVWSVLNT